MNEIGERLTVSEQEAARRQAIRALRKRLQLQRPVREDYLDGSAPRAARAVGMILHWSRFLVVLIALAAGVASAIRNVVAVFHNYQAAGAAQGVAVFAAVAFVVSVEAALFVIALAQAGITMRRRAEGAARHVLTWAGLKRAWRVRLGREAPLRYDELPERDLLGVVLGLAFAFAVVANLAVAMGPVLQATALPLQAYIASLPTQPGAVQMAFLLDVALALLPPALALIGGHLTARFALEYAQQGQAAQAQFEADLEAWRAEWADPLATDDGEAYLGALLREKAQRKGSGVKARPHGGNDRVPFDARA